jgi:hypothetical protein
MEGDRSGSFVNDHLPDLTSRRRYRRLQQLQGALQASLSEFFFHILLVVFRRHFYCQSIAMPDWTYYSARAVTCWAGLVWSWAFYCQPSMLKGPTLIKQPCQTRIQRRGMLQDTTNKLSACRNLFRYFVHIHRCRYGVVLWYVQTTYELYTYFWAENIISSPTKGRTHGYFWAGSLGRKHMFVIG